MYGDGDLENLILSVVERWHASRYTERHGLVTSYDPNKYLAKVTFQPEGQESGWLPIEANHVGKTYGIVVGLQPGQGGSGDTANSTNGETPAPSSNQGDQVIVRYQEGDFESGKVAQRVHSNEDTPPPVQSGEIMIYTKFQNSGGGAPDSGSGGQGGTGQQIHLKNDGSITVTDGNGGTLVFDGQGNCKITCKNLQIDASGTATLIAQSDVGIKGGNNVEVQAGNITGIDGGSFVAVQGGGSVADDSVSPPSAPPAKPPFSVPS